MIGLYHNSDEVDYVEFGAVDDISSVDREKDGASNWVEFRNATPGASNCPLLTNDDREPVTGMRP